MLDNRPESGNGANGSEDRTAGNDSYPCLILVEIPFVKPLRRERYENSDHIDDQEHEQKLGSAVGDELLHRFAPRVENALHIVARRVGPVIVQVADK